MTGKENPSYYAIIPANVRYDNRLKPNEKLMFGEITVLSNKNGYCMARNRYFADLYDVSIGTVSRWIKSLEDCGYIESVVIRNSSTMEVIERRVYLKNTIPSIEKDMEGSSLKDDYPIAEKRKDNSTSINTTSNNTLVASKDAQLEQVDRIVEMWNQIEGLPQVRRITETSKRYKYASARLKEEGFDTVVEVLQKVASSDFLRGKNRNNWTANFEWAMTASNFIKILEDTYINKENNHEAGRANNSANKLERIYEEGRRAIEEFDFENFDGTF